MIYVNLKGRIGNNLFQLATAASLAHTYGMNFIACPTNYWCSEPDNCYLKDYLKQFKHNILRYIQFEDYVPSDIKEFNESSPSFFPISFQKDIILNGWFQSEKYFVNSVVRELFKIDQGILQYIKDKYGRILFSEESITSVNVRRGDYLKLPQYYSICSMPYFNKAIDYIGHDKKYLIISDDIAWCKQHFRGTNFYFVDDEEPIIDLYLQTLCTNNIISNSTFSWWGAWLNKNSDKIVVAPTPWVGKFHKQVSNKDLIPEEWIQIENPVELKYRLKVTKIEIEEFLIEKWESLTSIKRKIKRKANQIFNK